MLLFFPDPYNCSDHCHLAWLLGDNRHLLDVLSEMPPACSKGTLFIDLNPDEFDDCPSASEIENQQGETSLI